MQRTVSENRPGNNRLSQSSTAKSYTIPVANSRFILGLQPCFYSLGISKEIYGARGDLRNIIVVRL
jgi:hypothetical protein